MNGWKEFWFGVHEELMGQYYEAYITLNYSEAEAEKLAEERAEETSQDIATERAADIADQWQDRMEGK